MAIQLTYDLYNNFGEDLLYKAGNDLLNTSELEKSSQRIIRRLMTNPGDYIWHSTYGAGLPSYIGKALTNDVYAEIQSTVISQIFLEDTVSKNPSPVITLQTIPEGLLIQINYTYSPTGQPVVLTFTVS